ncbi:MAG: protein kinase, partial [Mariniblastus sp.]|nr:protein kinase [Mariniblastus sp.]
LLRGHFIAKHTKTGFLVLLQFLPGTQTAHLKQWNHIESLVDSVSNIEHPNLAEIYETVVLSQHRFVVSQSPSGTSLAEKLPRKARLPWQKACSLVAQAANGLQRLHQEDFIHNAISPRTIWINKSGQVELRINPFPDPDFDIANKEINGGECTFDYRAPECPDRSSTGNQASDIYALGCTLFRAISGRPLFPELDPEKKRKLHQQADPPSLQKYELPEGLESLIKKMLAKNPDSRPQSVGEVANLLALHSGKADEINSIKLSNSTARMAFRQSLKQILPEFNQVSVAASPNITTDSQVVHESTAPAIHFNEADLTTNDRKTKIEAAAKALQRRKENRWKIPAAIALSLLALSGAIGSLAYFANQTKIVKEEDSAGKTKPKIGENTSTSQPSDDQSPKDSQSLVAQKLIDDDRKSLWETPTNGPPIALSYLPLSPKMLFIVRPNDLVTQPEGAQILKSLGPEIAVQLERLQDLSGLDLENMEQLIISLHSSESFVYEPFFIVKTTQPIDSNRLMQLWNRPTLTSLENQQDILESKDGQNAFYVLHDDFAQNNHSDVNDLNSGTQAEPTPNQPNEDETISRFAFGSKTLVEQVALSAGANALSGSLRKVADWTDNDRHINIMFLRNALFNDEGQQLMGEKLSGLNRELNILLPDDVRGGLLSLHLDSGNYLEIMLDKNFDLKAPELKQTMVEEMRTRRDLLVEFTSNIPPNPYWDRVRIRYASMLANLTKNLRWSVEEGEVVANCWLPPMAAHNLLAASELVVTFASGSSVVQVPTYTGPKTFEELLESKRDLNVANPPDLNVLMSDLEAEIKDDLGKLPFEFHIRLLGGDLEADGITKNQRPNELLMEQKSVAEILTSVMIQANPDKDITGANDPNCKLIWVVAEDPEIPGAKAILITTRAAAAKKSYQLPPAFKTQ